MLPGGFLNLVAAIDNLHVCPGHPDDHFVTMVQSRKDKMNKDVILDDRCEVEIEGKNYGITVRHSKCELLTEALKCPTCTAYHHTLRSMYSRHKKQRCSPRRMMYRSSPGSHVNFRYLTTPEKHNRYTRLRQQAKASKKMVEGLKRKIAEMTSANGVILDEDLDSDFKKIMDEHSDFIESEYPAKLFERLFWDQQKKS